MCFCMPQPISECMIYRFVPYTWADKSFTLEKKKITHWTCVQHYVLPDIKMKISSAMTTECFWKLMDVAGLWCTKCSHWITCLSSECMLHTVCSEWKIQWEGAMSLMCETFSLTLYLKVLKLHIRLGIGHQQLI